MSINSVDPSPEIGYSLLPESWNKGFATEALQLMLKMWWNLPRRDIGGNDHRGMVEKVYALCETNNEGSCRVLQKCGFQKIDQVQFGTDELYVWSLERPRESVSE